MAPARIGVKATTREESPMKRLTSMLGWIALSILGAFSLGYIALKRGETINAIWIVAAAGCVYLIAYRFYSLYIATKVMGLDPRRRLPPTSSTMVSTMSRPTRTSCSATTSPRSPAPARWSVPCWRPRWATCPA